MFSLMNIKALTHRYFLEYRKLIAVLLVGDIVERLLFFVAFGVGLGKAVSMMGGVDYKSFIAPGIAAGSGLFVMTMAMTYGVHHRYQSAEIWQSWLATPVKLPDILISELIFAALRALPALVVLYLVAYVFGAIPSVMGAVISLPVLLLANFVYGVIGLILGGFFGRMIYFKYIQTLWVMPMYLFSGVFYNIHEAPQVMQNIAHLFPLFHVLEMTRPLVLGQSLNVATTLTSLAVLLAICVVGFYVALKIYKRKLFD